MDYQRSFEDAISRLSFSAAAPRVAGILPDTGNAARRLDVGPRTAPSEGARAKGRQHAKGTQGEASLTASIAISSDTRFFGCHVSVLLTMASPNMPPSGPSITIGASLMSIGKRQPSRFKP